MKLKNIIIFVLILFIAVGAVYWKSKNAPDDASTDSVNSLEGEKLLAADKVENAEKIILENPESNQQVTIIKNGDGNWILPDHYGLNADFNKLERLIRSLNEGTVLRLITKNQKRIDRLEFIKNKVQLISADSKYNWSIDLGKTDEKGNYYVKLNETTDVYLAKMRFNLDTTIDNWADKKLIKFKAEDVAEIQIEFPDNAAKFILSRKNNSDSFTASDLKEQESVKNNEVTQFLNGIINMRYSKVMKSDDALAVAAKTYLRKFNVKLFSGDEYSFSIGRTPALPIVDDKKDTDTTNENKENIEPEEPKMSEPGPVFIFVKNSNSKDSINEIMNKAAFTFGDNIFNSLPASRDKFIEIKNEEAKNELQQPVSPNANLQLMPEIKNQK